MTDELREAVAVPAAEDARNSRARRWLALLAVVAAASALAFAGIAAEVFLREADLQTQVTALSDNAKQNNAAAQTLAEQVRRLGGTPVVSPPPGPSGAQGPAGPAGPAGTAGRGITGTAISSGHLYVTYTDGKTEDKGQVVGADGAAGRGITGANATSGHLVLAYSDGSTSDAGAVVGPAGEPGATGAAGRGITSVSTAGGQLTVTYTDGTTANAGPLPAGPPGPTGPQGVQGPPGSPPAGWTWTDELGRTYHCQRDPSSPDSAPTYTCSTAAPTSMPAARTRTTSR